MARRGEACPGLALKVGVPPVLLPAPPLYFGLPGTCPSPARPLTHHLPALQPPFGEEGRGWAGEPAWVRSRCEAAAGAGGWGLGGPQRSVGPGAGSPGGRFRRRCSPHTARWAPGSPRTGRCTCGREWSLGRLHRPAGVGGRGVTEGTGWAGPGPACGQVGSEETRPTGWFFFGWIYGCAPAGPARRAAGPRAGQGRHGQAPRQAAGAGRGGAARGPSPSWEEAAGRP